MKNEEEEEEWWTRINDLWRMKKKKNDEQGLTIYEEWRRNDEHGLTIYE